MAQQYAGLYSKEIDEKFRLGSLTEGAFKASKLKHDWAGVSTVSIYGVTTQALADYTMSGTARYGTPTDAATTKTDYTISKDRAFSLVLDQRFLDDTAGAFKAAGEALSRQIEEQLIPEIDLYRLTAIATAATTATYVATAILNSSTAYTAFLTACANMNNLKVPFDGRWAWVSPAMYNLLKLDANFVKASDTAMKMLGRGVVGEIDGVKIVMTPTSLMPANTNFILAHPDSLLSVKKLDERKVNTEPQGISGTLIEARFRYDAYVLANKTAGVYLHKSA